MKDFGKLIKSSICVQQESVVHSPGHLAGREVTVRVPSLLGFLFLLLTLTRFPDRYITLVLRPSYASIPVALVCDSAPLKLSLSHNVW